MQDQHPAFELMGRRIQRWRTLRDMSLRDLGEKAAIDHSTLSKVEHGRAKLSLDSLFRIADVLAVPAGLLLDTSADAAPVMGKIDADEWHPGEPFFAPDQIYPLPVAHHPDVVTGEAFRFNDVVSFVCERLEVVGKGLEEGAACVVWRRRRGKGSNLSLRVFTAGSNNPGPRNQDPLALAAGLRRMSEPDAFAAELHRIAKSAGRAEGSEDSGFYKAMVEARTSAVVKEVEADQQARTGWLVAAHGDPAARYLPANDDSIKKIWLVCSQVTHLR